MKNMPLITFEEFKSYICEIKNMRNLQDNLEKAATAFNKATKKEDDIDIRFPSLLTTAVSLLAISVGDETEWIDYWIFELEFGENYYDGCINDRNGNNVKIKTVEDLWNVIMAEKNKN